MMLIREIHVFELSVVERKFEVYDPRSLLL